MRVSEIRTGWRKFLGMLAGAFGRPRPAPPPQPAAKPVAWTSQAPAWELIETFGPGGHGSSGISSNPTWRDEGPARRSLRPLPVPPSGALARRGVVLVP